MVMLLCDYLHGIVAHLPSCHCTSNHFNFCMGYFEFFILFTVINRSNWRWNDLVVLPYWKIMYRKFITWYFTREKRSTSTSNVISVILKCFNGVKLTPSGIANVVSIITKTLFWDERHSLNAWVHLVLWVEFHSSNEMWKSWTQFMDKSWIEYTYTYTYIEVYIGYDTMSEKISNAMELENFKQKYRTINS